jgi:hypothetical protein
MHLGRSAQSLSRVAAYGSGFCPLTIRETALPAYHAVPGRVTESCEGLYRARG